MKALSFALAVLMLAIGARMAQAEDFEIEVENITIIGIDRVEASNVLANITFGKGSVIDAEVVAASITRLYATGLFRDVAIAREDRDVLITVVENPVIAAIRFNGMDNIDEEEVLELLKLNDIAVGRILRRGDPDDVQRTVAASYESTPHYLTTVSVSTVPDASGNVIIVVTVNEGAQVQVAQIRIYGNAAFDEDELLDLFEVGATSLLSIFEGEQAFTDVALKGDIERLRSHYLSAGFIRFRVLSTDVALDLDDGTIDIAVYISEGARYSFSEPLIIGSEALDEDLISELRPYEPGDIYSDVLAARYASRLRAALRERGHAFATVEDSYTIDDVDQQVQMKYTLVPRKLVEVRRIVFFGNNETSDEVLRRQFILFEGELFDGDKLRRSLVRLRRTGYLLSVQAREVPVSDSEVDIEVTVVEEAVGTLTFGLGYSKSEGVSYDFSFSRRNILGSGNDLALAGNFSDDESDFSLTFTQAFFTDTGISRSVNLYVSNEEEAADASVSFALDRLGTSVRYTIPIDDNWSWRPGLQLERISLENPNSLVNVTVSMADKYVAEYGGEPNFVNLLLGIRYDSRNRALNPTDGAFIRLNAEVGVPPGDLEYYQLEYNGNWYAGFDNNFVADLGTRVRYGDSYGSGIYPFYERFYFSSRGLRGFRASRILPDGGLLHYHSALRVSRPLGILDGAASAGVFINTGGLWPEASDFDTDDIRASAGIELRIATPVAPLRFTYAIPIKKKDNDIEERFQFQIGF